VKRRIKDMPAKEPGFAERLQTAAKAKKAQLEKSRALVPANGPHPTTRQAAQVGAAVARKIRTAERKESDRVGAQQREAQRAAEKARQARALVDEKVRKHAERDAERAAKAEADAALKQNQKTARDAKYAARKARQK
jgi:uncharacterized protein DUF6481